MGLKRRGSSGGGGNDKQTIVCENLEVGKEYEARLVYVADLGLHEAYGNDGKPDVQKIALGYEILGKTVEIDGNVFPRLMWDKPFNIYWKLTALGVELVKYKVFDPTAKENEEADWEKVLDTPVNIVVEHVADKKDKTKLYDNILSVTPIPKKYQGDVSPSSITPCIGDADDSDNAATKALYGLTNWMYERRLGEDTVEETPIDLDDEIPF